MIIACPSVPHTGHHFMKNRVFRNFNKCSPYDYVKGNVPDNSVIMGHFDKDFLEIWPEIIIEMPVFIPLRHPARCLVSYLKRNTIGSKVASHHGQWHSLIELSKIAVEVYYMHLDMEDIREMQVEKMCDVANINHEIDWSVNGESGSKHNTHDLAITDELLKDTPNEFIDFYYSKVNQNAHT